MGHQMVHFDSIDFFRPYHASTPNGALTGGEFTVDAKVSLNVPAYTAPGAYSGVLTLTLT
jgi:hypothetical protein